MKQYPTLSALLAGELGTRAPSPAAIERLSAQIRAAHPTAHALVFFKNGHWILLPVGPAEKLGSLAQARKHKIHPGRKPRAYCKI